jgi:hypothetical protein
VDCRPGGDEVQGLEQQRFHGLLSSGSGGLWGRAWWGGEDFTELGIQSAEVSAVPDALPQ